jgi:hypothetical protein
LKLYPHKQEIGTHENLGGLERGDSRGVETRGLCQFGIWLSKRWRKLLSFCFNLAFEFVEVNTVVYLVHVILAYSPSLLRQGLTSWRDKEVTQASALLYHPSSL